MSLGVSWRDFWAPSATGGVSAAVSKGRQAAQGTLVAPSANWMGLAPIKALRGHFFEQRVRIALSALGPRPGCIRKSRLPSMVLVISLLATMALSSVAVSQDQGLPAAEQNDGASRLQVRVQEGPEGEVAGQPAASSDEATDGPSGSAQQSADQPGGSAQRATGEADPSAEGPLKPVPENSDAEEPLKPIPDPRNSGPPPVEAASFNGVTPGVTTLSELGQLWGPPKQTADRNAQLVHLYAVGPFEHVEVSFIRDRVAAIAIHLAHSFPADRVAQELKLGDIQPILVSNELGEILGQSFPERGVMFAFEPPETPGAGSSETASPDEAQPRFARARASFKVTQIILEPISAEPFVLRAETLMDRQPESSLRDLDQAIKLDANHARAHWLRSRLLAAGFDPQGALAAVDEALRLEPKDPQYRATRAEILGQLGRFAEGVEEAQKAVADGTKRPHVKARALCLLGDLIGSQPAPDYKQALASHVEAIKLADPLALSRHPAIRLAAKEVLIDAHLGAAHDIAWGSWTQKEKAVPQWLDRAAALAEDLVDQEDGSAEHRFRVATRALAAYAGLRGKLDPTPWTEEALDAAKQLLAATPDSARKRQITWEVGMALYDVVQILQMQGKHDQALEYGEKAATYLESAAAANEVSSSRPYLLGRLYFRLGAIHAIGRKDHPAAVGWFDQSLPILESSASRPDQNEVGRLGETFVSMAVSYWETGRRDRAVHLTERGVQLVEQAVRDGTLKRSDLEIPYSNLATMLRQMGESQRADKYLREAKRSKGSGLR